MHNASIRGASLLFLSPFPPLSFLCPLSSFLWSKCVRHRSQAAVGFGCERNRKGTEGEGSLLFFLSSSATLSMGRHSALATEETVTVVFYFLYPTCLCCFSTSTSTSTSTSISSTSRQSNCYSFSSPRTESK